MRTLPLLLAVLVVCGVAQAENNLKVVEPSFVIEKLTKEACEPFYERRTVWEGFIWDEEKQSCYVSVTSVSGESVRVYINENWEFTEVIRTKGESK